MSYERKLTDEQVEKLNRRLTEEMHVMDATNTVIKVQVGVLKDILIDAGITTEKEVHDRSMDLTYGALQKTGLI